MFCSITALCITKYIVRRSYETLESINDTVTMRLGTIRELRNDDIMI